MNVQPQMLQLAAHIHQDVEQVLQQFPKRSSQSPLDWWWVYWKIIPLWVRTFVYNLFYVQRMNIHLKCQTYIIIYLSFSRSLFNAKKKSPKSLQPLQASIGHLSSFSAHEISPLSQTCRSWRLRHSVFCTCGMSSKPVIYQLYIVLPSVIWYVLGRVENILGIIVIQEQGITKKPTSISWNDRGILNTAHMWNVWGI